MVPMDLAAYQRKHQLSVSGLAAQIGVTVQALHRYMHRGRIPKEMVMRRILAVTCREVTADDFYLAPQQTFAPKRRAAA